MSTLQTISPERAAELVRQGAVLIDVREAGEHAREYIPGARHHALTKIDRANPVKLGDGVLIFHCRSGARTESNSLKLADAAQSCEAFILDGGLNAWKKAGLPVTLDRNQPIDVIRQVQIVAGGMILIGVMLGVFVAPAFYALSAFVGAGLLFAGISGFCGMARLLELMPWNRRAFARAK